MEWRGHVRKMRVALGEDEVLYSFPAEQPVSLNDCIGRSIHIRWTGNIQCALCNKSIRKTYGNGSCYDCFTSAPENAECIIRPELCMAHLGEGRDVEWEEKFHNKPHVVYLACSSGLKVGVTRAQQVPNRWIDQGASKAVILAKTPYRQLAGAIEVCLKDRFNDRTNWRKMLTNQFEEPDFAAAAEEARALLPNELAKYLGNELDPYEIPFPVLQYPEKVKSINLQKEPEIEEHLTGIKGQYLIFDSGRVLNVRKYTGYEWIFSA